MRYREQRTIEKDSIDQPVVDFGLTILRRLVQRQKEYHAVEHRLI